MNVKLILGSYGGGVVVDEELRGWRLGSNYSVLVRPSELTSLCPTKRDVWLVRRGARLCSGCVRRGVEYHNEVLTIIGQAVILGWEGLRRVLSSVKTHAGIWALTLASAWLSNGAVPPIAIEPKLPPAAGFTSSRPDLVIGSSPTEVLYSNGRSDYLRRKEVEVCAYGMILEALLKYPVDRGYLVVITDDGVSTEEVILSNSLREEVLVLRDEVARVLSSDEAPPIPSKCVEGCPLSKYCLGGSNE